MSAVTILTNAAQARSGASSAFDATAFSTLRLDLRVSADLGVSPMLKTFVETGPTSAGPWRVIDERSYHHSRDWPTSSRVALSGFDAFVRLRWEGGRHGEPKYSGPAQEAPSLVDPKFVIGLAGDGQPNAA